MSTSTKWCLMAAAVVLTAGCIGDVGDGLGFHACEVNQSSGWSGYDLALRHQEPRQCPVVFRFKGQSFETGAEVVDGGTRNFQIAQLTVFNSDNVQLKSTISGFIAGVNNEWKTDLWTTYNAATGAAGVSGFDRSEFKMVTWIHPQTGTLPSSIVKTSYRSDMTASISGVAQPGANQWVTYSANITGGGGSYQYHWYRNGAWIGTGQSISVYTGDSQFPLEVHTTDSEGGLAIGSTFVATQVDCTINPAYPC